MSSPPALTAPTRSDDPPGTGEAPTAGHRWWILALVSLAQLMVVLDATIVNIALPSAQRALGFSTADRQWVVTAYSLAFASLLLLGGRLSDLIGRKRMMVIGLAGFAAASAVGGLSTDFAMLVAARAVQGAFGALLAPAALSTLTTTFTRADERRTAYGIYGAISGGGAIVGLLLGGALTEYLSWRWCLYVNVILAVVALSLTLVFLRHRAEASAPPHLDLLGVIQVSAGLFSIVFGFSRAETGGWLAGETLGFLAAGVVLLVGFGVHQARSDHPLLPLRILADRGRGGSLLAVLLAAAGMFGVFLFVTFYLQQTLGYSALKTGFAFLPMMAAVMIASTGSSQYLSTKVGPRWIVAPGMLVAAAGLVLLTRIGIATGYDSHVLPGLLLIGVGIGLIFSSAMNQGTARLAVDDAGVGSAVVTTMQQLGGSIGTALLNTVAASAVAAYVVGRTATAHVAAEATIHGYSTAFWWAAGIFAVGFVICGALLRGAVPAVDPDADLAPLP
jgi:EmrB/QacA subfamily drug resistance transporter